jgi:hypothetical protein
VAGVRIFVAGPMRGLPQYNFPAFLDAAAALRDQGHEVFTAAERELAQGFDPAGMDGTADLGLDRRRADFADDMHRVCTWAEMVITLDGWETSLGAQAEVMTALAVGLEVLPFPASVYRTGPPMAAGKASAGVKAGWRDLTLIVVALTVIAVTLRLWWHR